MYWDIARHPGNVTGLSKTGLPSSKNTRVPRLTGYSVNWDATTKSKKIHVNRQDVRPYVRMYVYVRMDRRTFETHFIRSTQKSQHQKGY